MLLSALCALGPTLCYAEEQVPASSKEPIVVNGDKVEYFHEKKEVVGVGNVSITYRDVVLTCRKITVHLDSREATAEGDVKVTQQDAYFTGEKIVYNFDTRKGTILDGYLNANPFYGKAREVDKIANKDQINLERGYVTTCDLDKPHYRLAARQVRVYLDDKVVARDIIFYIGDVPVAYLPYYVQPLKERKTHFTVVAGQSKDWGYYVLTAYRYYLTDKFRGDLLLDYRSKEGMGLAGGVNQYFNLDKMGNGSAKFYYTEEGSKASGDHYGEDKRRYRWQVRHRLDMDELDSHAILEFNKLSDRNIIRDYFYNEYAELGDNPDNYISLITQKPYYASNFLLRKRFDKFYTVVERLPEYSMDIYSAKIGDTPLYYKANASVSYLNKKTDNSNNAANPQKDIDIVRFDTYYQLSYATRIFRSLATMPYVGTQNTYFSRNRWGDTNEIRTVFNAGIDNSIKFYKVYDVNSDFLDLDLHQLRHIVTPTANYYFKHQPTISPDNLNQFDSIDSVTEQNGIVLGLENKLQTKRYSGDQLKSVDLATLLITSDYMFRLKDDNIAYKSQKFKSVDFRLELVPYPWLYSLAKMTVDTKRYKVQTESIDLVASMGDRWSLAVGQYYEDAADGKRNFGALDLTYKITEKWGVRAYERLDLGKKAFEEHEYTIYRDLHCWRAEFTVDIRNTSDITFWFLFTLKAFPQYPVGFKREYSRPEFGSTRPPADKISLIGG